MTEQICRDLLSQFGKLRSGFASESGHLENQPFGDVVGWRMKVKMPHVSSFTNGELIPNRNTRRRPSDRHPFQSSFEE